MALTLWDLLTDDEVRLAEDSQAPENASISLTHAAWVAYGGPDKDVFYVDLLTKEITHVQSTWEPYAAYTATWGDWLLWEQRANASSTPSIHALRYSTGEELQLANNGANGRPTLRGNLACFRTTRWSAFSNWDLVVYDMDTGVLRRVTRSSHWGYKCGAVDSGWLVYQKQPGGDYLMNEIHAVDLVAAGILDATGHHVLPE